MSGDESGTGLEDTLKQKGIERVVVVGLATDYCVKETASMRRPRDSKRKSSEEAIAAVNLEPDDGAKAIEAIEQAGGKVRSADE